MSSLDSLFESEAKPLSHPRIRSWSLLLETAKNPTCEIFRRRDGLSFLPAQIYVQFTPDCTEKEEWDTALNIFLIKKNVRARDEENEGIRFALMLRDFLKSAEV